MSAASTPVLTEVHAFPGGDVLEITINRPEKHNCVDGPTARLLLEAWTRFRDDDSLGVAILRGAGEKGFCSGADLAGLEQLAQLDLPGGDPEEKAVYRQGPMGGTRIVQRKPVITCTQGYTYAGGLELFCHGHIRLAEPAASFSVACRRWGVPLVDGGTVYLPRLIGWGPALPLIITGQRITAERAYQLGLVWELVPSGQGRTRALDMARQIVAQPRDALLADLASALEGTHLPLEAALERESQNLTPCLNSQSMQQGVQKFLSGAREWFE